MSVSGLKLSPLAPTVMVWTAVALVVVEEGGDEEVTVLVPELPGFPYWAPTRVNKQRMGRDLKN